MQNETVFTAVAHGEEGHTESCFQEFSVTIDYWTEQLLMICKDDLHISDQISKSCGARRLTLRTGLAGSTPLWFLFHMLLLQAGNVAQ